MEEKRLEESKALDKAYANLFNGVDGLKVLDDLRKYCLKDDVGFRVNDREEAYVLGMKSVLNYVERRVEMKFTERMAEMMEVGNYLKEES